MKKLVVLIVSIIFLCGCSFNFSNGLVTDDKIQISDFKADLKVHFLDVGEADSAFIELPNKEMMLIDAGEAKNSAKIISYIKDLGYEKLHYVIGTHPHADHIGGLSEIIKAFEIGSIYMPRVVATSKTYENLLKTISDKGLRINSGKAGVEVINDDELMGEIIAPNKDKYNAYNNYSIVLKLSYKEVSYLFTGDAEGVSEKEIKSDVKADILKVGHHGSNTSSGKSFLDQVKPKYAIISVGSNNKYGHPKDEVLERLKKYTNNIYRTDINGNIVVLSDGKNIVVETEK